jgi:hypothetical protein
VLLGEPHDLVGVLDRLLGAGDQRCADLLGDVACPHLVAEALDRARGRADPGQAGVDHRTREVGVLGEEAVAGVHGVGAGLLREGDDLADVEVGVGRCRSLEAVGLVGQPHEQGVAVGLRVDRHAADAAVLAGTDHADRDLAPVGDEDLVQRCRLRHAGQRIAPAQPPRPGARTDRGGITPAEGRRWT